MTDEITCDGVFEAKLVRENKSAKGIFLTLEIAADDYYAARLETVRPGALLKIGYQEQVDTSVHRIEVTPSEPIKIERQKERKAFADMDAPQQAGMLCDDARFQTFLCRTYQGDWYAAETGDIPTEVAAWVVRKICGIPSRARLDPKHPDFDIVALERWKTLLARYEQYKTDQQYGDRR